MKRKMVHFLVASLVLFSTACKQSTVDKSEQDKGVVITAEDYRKLKEDDKNDNKRFAIIGYPHLEDMINIDSKKETNILIYTEPNGKGEMIVRLPIGFGNKRNACLVTDRSSINDIKLLSNEGLVLNLKDKAMFSFTIDLKTENKRRQNFYFKKKRGSSIPKKIRTLGYFYVLKDIRIDKV